MPKFPLWLWITVGVSAAYFADFSADPFVVLPLWALVVFCFLGFVDSALYLLRSRPWD